ncbi:MAG: low molecular weight phosphotyrosine protein phosphatase [Idiomarina sp.]|nr:low molecular weight phosphotyrosine protein phosphatase [Idiomarina sp.]
MFDKILVVCIGNICRSPTAEFLLKAHLPNKQIESAGLYAMKGHDMDRNAKKIASGHGHSFPTHVARQFDSEMAREFDLILVMEADHRNMIAEKYPEAMAKTMLLGKWQDNKDIPDPYKKSDEVFEHVFKMLDSATASWASKLK